MRYDSLAFVSKFYLKSWPSRHGDDDLSLMIACTKQPKRFRHIGERVQSVNHR